MLHRRLVAVVLVRNGHVVQSIGFCRYLPVGSPAVTVEYLSRWGVDEVVLLDITASAQRRTIEAELVETAAGNGFVPLTVGGGLRTVSDMRETLNAGADKVSINTAAVDDPDLLGEAARMFGRQCIVVSIDVRRREDGGYEVYRDSGRNPTGLCALDHARRMEAAGAGEILLNAINRDGLKTGFDLDLAAHIVGGVDIPVVCVGGAGHPRHFQTAMGVQGISGVAAANIFHYTEHSVITIKRYLRNAGLPIRIDSHADYMDAAFDDAGRLDKRDDTVLEQLMWEHHADEVI